MNKPYQIHYFEKCGVVFTLPKYLIWIFIWCIGTAQECSETSTDACGSFPNNHSIGNIKMTLITNIPYGAPRPFLTTSSPAYIDICKSTNSSPATVFNIKVESYVQCNGIPRSRITGCKTASEGCSSTSTNDLQIIWNPSFKNKVSIKAISYFGIRPDAYNIYYGIYEGSMDIEAGQTSLTNPIVNLTLRGLYTETRNFNIITEICNTF